ncbi:MAG: GLUG motif-containing protein, partial [Planctomycetota bacterium]
MYRARKSNLLGEITMLLIICCCCLSAQAKYGGGTGEPNDPYLIYTAEQMNAIGADSNDWDKHFLLCADIDLSAYTGTSFNIIGSNWDNPFNGVFDGNVHTISNFSYISPGTSYIGVFGYVSGDNAVIKDLGLIDPYVDAGIHGRVGSLVGWLREATITNCYAERGSVSGNELVGGLVGSNDESTISNCYSTASVSGNYLIGGLVGYNWDLCVISNCYSTGSVTGDLYVGGLVGYNYSGTITNCDSSGDVEGNSAVGGLVGWTWDYSTITNCFSSGNVTGNGSVGGLVGINHESTISNCYSTANVEGGVFVGGLVGGNREGSVLNCSSTGNVNGVSHVGGLVGHNQYGTITNCYATASVSADDGIGGLVGINSRATITNCYSTGCVDGNDNIGGLVGLNDRGVTESFWDIETSGQNWSAGGTGKTTAEMQMEATFTDAGWDFNTPVWTIDEGVDYPRLWWEFVPILYAEPEVTLGTGNTISWEPVVSAVEYYAECAEDANFISIVYNSGWITETSFE